MATDRTLPARARVVVIGGGVGGTSIAYHLAELGERDVVLLDRAELTSGSTFHSAGLVGQLRADPTLTRMNTYSAELYAKLEATEHPVGWVPCGGIRLACTPERLQETRRQIGWARTFDLPLREISAAEAKELFPLMSTDGVLGGSYLPTDGYVDPSQLTYSLAAGARAGGVRIFTKTRVLGIDLRDGRVHRVRTDSGEIEAEIVVNCGGMFAAEIGRMAGVRVPIVPMSHQYLVTDPVRPRDGTHLPTLRDPDNLVYWREEVDGLLMGGYERDSRPWAQSGAAFEAIPADFNGKLLSEDWDRFTEIGANAEARVPVMGTIGVRRMINGPEAFTPDNEFCLGETEVGGFFVAAGFCAHGIAGAGGVGKVMAEWIVSGDPGLDVSHMDIRRFGRHYGSPAYTRKRVVENYETYYDIPYPHRERSAGRPLRVSPAYSWHVEHGATFGEKSGWERVNQYESNVDGGDASLRPHDWAGRNWSPAIGAEHIATRERAGLFDESSFAKISVSGRGAAELLNWLCANDVAREIGAVTYTQALNARGGIECDFTVTRLAEDEFMIVTGTAFGSHDMGWLRKHAGPDVRIADVTGQFACFALWGPRARDILAPLTPADLGNEAFPYLTAQETTVGDVPVRALRVTFVGELGWELYCSAEYGAALWRALWAAGEEHGLVAGGYRAIDSLRLEKGYRLWGSDLSPEVHPYEAGLGFCVKLDKPFLGRDALIAARERGLTRKLACLVLDDPRHVVLGSEPVRVDGKVLTRVTSGGYGYTVGASIAYAYLPVELAKPGTRAEVELFGTWVPAVVSKQPLFDPRGERVRQ
ncbi:FAD-dependent oxidoreductase [Allokutzneria sp. A3M-2-11 16]|uniref:GcvT family protein n=1 Tax=Allokutzneria sp. A3M-2-11 16 TaxID=2962043 RepID=UPI0020B8AC91|nr:FAD-dependent oxidoreductase [Allokutzneria sp. A3M-2-11 16]MCP3799676.1 FAD-dependent oxidoreductase [Allokutzneria sp. A3M-2-11 16]